MAKKADRATLLVELLTEELPPKSLRTLSEAFANRLLNDLIKRQLKVREPHGMKSFATPRRLAVLIPDVEAVGQDRENEVTGPSSKAPPQAIEGFAKKHGVAVADLERRATPKGEVVVARVKTKGRVLGELLPSIVEEALKALPIPKVMRWGAGEAQFVRPVHGVVMLHGAKPVPGTVLGVEAGRHTRGHRFMGKARIAVKSADSYEAQLRDEGMVLADIAARRAEIEHQLQAKAKTLGGSVLLSFLWSYDTNAVLAFTFAELFRIRPAARQTGAPRWCHGIVKHLPKLRLRQSGKIAKNPRQRSEAMTKWANITR